MFNVVVVDDEKPARDRLKSLLTDLPKITIVGEASNGKEAIEIIRSENPDLVLLDIQMPLLDGFDVVNLLGPNRPSVIFVTAHDEYAINAFEVHAVDYLLKPVKKERLFEALNRVNTDKYDPSIEKLINNHIKDKENNLQRLPIRNKQEVNFIDYSDICYFEADGKLTWLYTKQKNKYRTDFSLKELEKRFENYPFLRIHRSYIANLKMIKAVEPFFNGRYKITMSNGEKLEVARRRAKKVKSRLGIK